MPARQRLLRSYAGPVLLAFAALWPSNAGAQEVTDLRVTASPNIWDWLGTHLSLGFVRLKTVRITGTMHH